MSASHSQNLDTNQKRKAAGKLGLAVGICPLAVKMPGKFVS